MSGAGAPAGGMAQAERDGFAPVGSNGAGQAAFAGAVPFVGRRDAAQGFREFDTSGMPVLPGLAEHGTAAMPAAAPVPDSAYGESAPSGAAAVLRVPHGTPLWEADGDGDGAPVAVYDAIGGAWAPVRADALPAQRGE